MATIEDTAQGTLNRTQTTSARRRTSPSPRQSGNGYGQAADDNRLAQGLGWFAIGLGITQLLAPRGIARVIGVNEEDMNPTFMRALGIREIASGIGILSQQRPVTWLRARVAGDVMDLALLGTAMRMDNTRRGPATAAVVAVAGVTALDVLASTRESRATHRTNGSKNKTPSPQEIRQTGVEVKESITINRPPEEVYTFWHDFENLPSIMRHLESVDDLGGGRSHWTAKAPAGATVEWDAIITDDRPNERIAWRSVENSDVPNTGSVRFVRAPGGRGTEVHVELSYTPPAGKLGAVVAKLFGEEPSQQVREDLRAVKQIIEVGEITRAAT